MKLIQLNAWGGRLEFPISDFLEDEKPDILCLQEAISLGAASGSGLFITTEGIQKKCGLTSAAFSPAFSFNYMSGLAKFGNGIFSRFDIMQTETVFTHQEHKDNFVWSDDEIANMRNFVHALIDIDGKSCHVITHHGYWVEHHKNGDDETMQQMNTLADYIERLEGPIILAGDFNLVPHSPSLKRLNEKLTNLTVKHDLKTTRTSLTHKTEVCDYIFVNKDVKVKSFEAADKIISDHKALILDFDLN